MKPRGINPCTQWRRSPCFFVINRRMAHRTHYLRGNEISNIAYTDFLTSDIDHGKNLVDEACSKHPLNPKDVPRQKPGEDLAPIPVPNDTRLSIGSKIRKIAPDLSHRISQHVPTGSHSCARESTIDSNTSCSPKKPVIPINPVRSAEIQKQANLGDDKKYKCHICEKQFRVLLALKNHMVIRHNGAEIQLSQNAPPAVSYDALNPQTNRLSNAKSTTTVSLKRIENELPESTSDERSALRSNLLDIWDILGKEKWGREKYRHCRIYTEKEIRTLAENSKNRSEGIRTFQESGARESRSVDPKPISCSIPQAISVSEKKVSSEVHSSPNTPVSSGTFNPFASLVSDDGTTPDIFDKSAETVAANLSSQKAEETKEKPRVEIMVDGEKKYQCTICGKAFKTQIGLTGHFETKHPGQATGIASSGTTTEGGKYAIPVNLEDIPAYVPTPVDMSKFPGQGAGEVDPKAVALAEELRNTTVSLEQDVVVHARACTNITLSGVVVEMQSGYQGLIPVLQFCLLLESDSHTRRVEDKDGVQQIEKTIHPTETIVVRVYGSSLVKRAQTSIREGNLVLVVGLLKLNPVPLGNRNYNNPFVTVSDGGGTVLTLY